MKIFKRKKDSLQHELLEQIGVDSYSEIPDEFDADSWDDLNMQTFKRHSLRAGLRRKMRQLPYKLRFEKIVENFASSIYEIGSGDFDGFAEEQRFAPRARYLLKNKWLVCTFGIYQLEYTIAGNIGFSHYSLDNGLTFVIHMETELTKNHELDIKVLTDLFQSTEKHLHRTIMERTPPHTPNYSYPGIY